MKGCSLLSIVGKANSLRASRFPAFFLLIFVVIGQVSCASRPDGRVLVPVSDADPNGRIVRVYFATTRTAATPGPGYTAEPALHTTYGYYDISIPSRHLPGTIAWPRSKPDPKRDFVVTESGVLSRNDFLAAVGKDKTRRSAPRTDIFVHGYNKSFQESLFRLAQVSVDSSSNTVPVLFSWPSEGKPFEYIADKEAALYSRDALARLLVVLTQQTGPTLLFGHSMGGWLVMEALRTLKLADRQDVLNRIEVVLAAPDIDIYVFRQQLTVIGRPKQPIVVLVSKDDRALALSARIAGGRSRLGAVDVNNPIIIEKSNQANIQVIDISVLKPDNLTRHSRYIQLARIFAAQEEVEIMSRELQNAGAYVLNTVGNQLLQPVRIRPE